MASAVQITFKNLSNDVDNSKVYFFQRNVMARMDELPVAWKVIEHCSKGEIHTFGIPLAMQVGAKDLYGDMTPLLDAAPGQAFEVVTDHSGDVLRPSGRAASPTEVQVENNLDRGSFDAGIYKDGRLLAVKSNVYPQSMAAFEFKPSIWIGTASQVVEGQLIGPARLDHASKAFTLAGIASATIVMTGGGAGAAAQPLQFDMTDIVYA